MEEVRVRREEGNANSDVAVERSKLDTQKTYYKETFR